MSKTLILLRHGKAEDGGIFTPDFNRNLNEKGKNQIKFVAENFKKLGIFPEKILCSSANRTKQTLQVFIENFKIECPIEFKENLYLVHEFEIHEIISEQNKNCLMVVGHNYGISNLGFYYTKNMNSTLKTGEMLIIEFEKDFIQNTGKLISKISIRNNG